MAPKSVLIVEDDKDIRENMNFILRNEGYETLQAENGQVALDLLRAIPESSLPGCILLDLMMPVMDGLTFISALQSSDPDLLARVPIVIMSAKPDLDAEVRQISIPLELLKKPIDLEALFEILDRHCGKQTDLPSQ